MKTTFYAQPRVRILAICTGRFGSDFLRIETFEVQELDDMMFLQLHLSDTFQLSAICIAETPATFSRAKPQLLQHPSVPCGY
jgi:hypothetical protein